MGAQELTGKENMLNIYITVHWSGLRLLLYFEFECTNKIEYGYLQRKGFYFHTDDLANSKASGKKMVWEMGGTEQNEGSLSPF